MRARSRTEIRSPPCGEYSAPLRPGVHRARSQLPSRGDHQAGRALAAQVVLAWRAFGVVQHHRAADRGVAAAGPVEAGVQLEREQHQPPHQAVETFACGALHHLRDQGEVEVGVAEVAARRVPGVPGLGVGGQRLDAGAQRHVADAEYGISRHQAAQQVAYATARSDLLGLVALGLFTQHKRGKGFVFAPVADLSHRLNGSR